MIYPNSNRQSVFKAEKACGYKLAEVNQRELVQLELDPQGEIGLHSLPVHVTFYVIAGEGQLIADSSIYTANIGDVLEVEPGSQRAWLNTGDSALIILVIKEMP